MRLPPFSIFFFHKESASDRTRTHDWIEPPRLEKKKKEETVTKVSREFDSCRTHFLCEKRKMKKEEASPQGKNKAMWGEEAKPLKHKNDAERKSDL